MAPPLPNPLPRGERGPEGISRRPNGDRQVRDSPPAKKPQVEAKPATKAEPPATKVQAADAPVVQAGDDPGPFLDRPAFAIKTDPPTGSVDVDPALAEVRVTWSREMKDGSWSWSSLGRDHSLPIHDKIHYDKDRRTCVAPVKLEPGKTYAVYLNSPKFTNFRYLEGRPAVPYLLVFKTRAAK